VEPSFPKWVLSQRDTARARQAPDGAWAPRHDVQLSVSEDALAASAARFLVEGVRAGQPIIVVVTPTHRAGIAAQMRTLGIEPDDLAGGDAIWLDARDTLDSLMDGTRISKELFDAAVNGLFERLKRGREDVVVRAFGEMVDLLWTDGKVDAAIQLENLWNDLATRHSLCLLCSYSADGVLTADGTGLDQICAVHTRVLRGDGTTEA
jgi:KaiC/GvpD/RAD55 family RecA-like ATPase